MKIGIIKAGRMGGGPSAFWATEGQRVKFSFSYAPGKLDSLAQAFGSAGFTGTPAAPRLVVGEAVAATGRHTCT
jgi:predicted dinucleotide-binding enzyme